MEQLTQEQQHVLRAALIHVQWYNYVVEPCNMLCVLLECYRCSCIQK